jgi:hypothetical protein
MRVYYIITKQRGRSYDSLLTSVRVMRTRDIYSNTLFHPQVAGMHYNSPYQELTLHVLPALEEIRRIPPQQTN